MLNNKELKELISAARQYIDLQESVIEKDYYITDIINAIAHIENENFRLIFCGGTCLAKAHKMVKRMSEDIDFKMQLKKPLAISSKSYLLKELKKFRSQIMKALELPHITISHSTVRNEGQYLRAELTYSALFRASDALRPHLLLEFTLSNIRLPTESLLINTLIEDVIKVEPLFPSSPIHCISTDETAIEKWVGLTRRIAAIERGYHEDDSTLIRHIYDLNSINQASKISENFFKLAKHIINEDAKQFKNQHPEYFNNPVNEIRYSLKILKTKPLWKERYQEFLDTMVYDKTTTSDYDKAIQSIENISKKVIASLKRLIV